MKTAFITIGTYFLIGALSSGFIVFLVTRQDDPSGDANLAGCVIAFAMFFAWWLVWPWLIWSFITDWQQKRRWKRR